MFPDNALPWKPCEADLKLNLRPELMVGSKWTLYLWSKITVKLKYLSHTGATPLSAVRTHPLWKDFNCPRGQFNSKRAVKPDTCADSRAAGRCTPTDNQPSTSTKPSYHGNPLSKQSVSSWPGSTTSAELWDLPQLPFTKRKSRAGLLIFHYVIM